MLLIKVLRKSNVSHKEESLLETQKCFFTQLGVATDEWKNIIEIYIKTKIVHKLPLAQYLGCIDVHQICFSVIVVVKLKV